MEKCRRPSNEWKDGRANSLKTSIGLKYSGDDRPRSFESISPQSHATIRIKVLKGKRKRERDMEEAEKRQTHGRIPLSFFKWGKKKEKTKKRMMKKKSLVKKPTLMRGGRYLGWKREKEREMACWLFGCTAKHAQLKSMERFLDKNGDDKRNSLVVASKPSELRRLGFEGEEEEGENKKIRGSKARGYAWENMWLEILDWVGI